MRTVATVAAASCWQTIGHDGHRALSLPAWNMSTQVGILSPYFQMNEMRRVGAGRDKNFSLKYMDFLIDSLGVAGGNPYGVISWWDGSGTFQSSDIVFMTIADVKTSGLAATLSAAISTYASGHSLTVNSVKGLPGTLSGAPQAAIGDAPADATTNYNAVTTLLGSLTGAVNTANTKQNDIATRLNSLLSELRTLGLIAA